MLSPLRARLRKRVGLGCNNCLHVSGFRRTPSTGGEFFSPLCFLAVVWPAWAWLPGMLAKHYNDRGFHQTNSDPSSAVQNYERAVALDRGLSRAHFNLAELYESFCEYAKASAEYQSAIVSDRSYVKGYNNLARVLLLAGKPLTALRVVDDGLAIGIHQVDQETEAALRKNRAWAECELGFYEQAVRDAELSVRAAPSSAAAYCLLGKAYQKLGKRSVNSLHTQPKGSQTQVGGTVWIVRSRPASG